MILQLRRWLSNRPPVMVADSGYAALDLFAFCKSMTRPVTFIHHPAASGCHALRTRSTPTPIRWVLIRDGLHRFDPQALLCTDPTVGPVQIASGSRCAGGSRRRFRRPAPIWDWRYNASGRIAPYHVLGLFSWTILAVHLLGDGRLSTPRPAAWHVKSEPTFVGAIALVRCHLWIASETLCMSLQKPDMRKVPTPMLNRFIESLTYAV